MPGDETKAMIADVGRLAREDAATALERSEESAELRRQAQRERDMRRLLWIVLAAAVAVIGTAAAFWDDIVRNEVRLERLEQGREAPKRSWLDRFRD